MPTVNKTQNVTANLTVNALTPTITSLWPSAALINTGPLTLTVRGTGFFKGTTAKVTGQATPLKTTYISATTMLAELPASMIGTAGTLPVVVANPRHVRDFARATGQSARNRFGDGSSELDAVEQAWSSVGVRA